MLLAAAMAMLMGWQPQPLSGPAVQEKGRSGLVQHEMSGRVIRPEKTIEQAAAEKLDLTPAVRAKVEGILTERAAAIDRFVTENLLLLNQLQTVGAAGTVKEKVVLGLDLMTRIGEAIRGQSLKDAIAAVLPADRADTFKAMLREYWRALHAEGAALKLNDPPPPWAVYLGESLASLGREIARSFERQSASGTLFVDYLLSGLNLNEQQQQTIRELKLDLLQRTDMRPSEEDQKQLILGAAAYLTQEQRGKVLARVAGKK